MTRLDRLALCFRPQSCLACAAIAFTSGRTGRGTTINPLEYLTDVLGRIGDHPASRLDELLPANWASAQD